MRMRSRVIAFLFPLLLFLSACQVQLYTDLDEEQVNAMLSLLLSRGVEAEKKTAGKGMYALAVEEDQVVFSLRLLRENSLPRDSFATLGTVFSASGMISSAAEEQARLMWALSQELSNTFSRIDGVLTSRVHVVLGVNDSVNNVKIPPSATVFLRYAPDSLVTTLVPEIRRATAGAVAGLKVDNVTVMLVPVRESVTIPNPPAPAPPSLFNKYFSIPLLLQTIALALLFSAIGIAIFYLVIRKRLKKEEDEAKKEA